ncbi:MAG: hypothetical protein AVDCRST_MAG79-724, partial [uncultured Thermoleophilia bacterium]
AASCGRPRDGRRRRAPRRRGARDLRGGARLRSACPRVDGRSAGANPGSL